MSDHHTNSTRPMGLALKAVMACLALTATVVHAATITVQEGESFVQSGSLSLRFAGGSGSLQFSNGTIDPATGLPGVPTIAVGGLVGALNVGKVAVTPVGDVTIAEDTLLIGNRVKNPARAAIRINAGVSTMTIDDATGQILGVQSVGGARQAAAFQQGVLDGGEAVVSNLRFDLVGKRVYADLVSRPGTDAERIDSGVHLWSFDSFTGPTALPKDAWEPLYYPTSTPALEEGFTLVTTANGERVLRADNILKGLRVTDQGFNFFAGALGLTQGSTGYETLRGVNSATDGWGSISSSMYFAPVPEPSTYALMGLGLVGVAAVARRRKA